MIDIGKIMEDVESSWGMGGLSSGLYSAFTCAVTRAAVHSLVTTLTKELSSGAISIEGIEFRANELIAYPDA